MSSTPNRLELIAAIASKEYTGSELSIMFDMPVSRIRKFVESNREEIEAAFAALEQLREEVEEIAEASNMLWIRDQHKRLHVYQTMVERLYATALISFDATVLRELRSYMYYAAQELGQLQHRGSAGGDGTTVTYSIEGVDMENLR